MFSKKRPPPCKSLTCREVCVCASGRKGAEGCAWHGAKRTPLARGGRAIRRGHAPKSDLIIHIRKGNDATFYAPNISDYTATAVFSDMVTYQGQPVPLTVTQTADEYLIEVPEFTCTMVVCIDISQ